MGDFCRVLIVEDEFLLRQGIKNLVNWEEKGFKVVGEASNGKEALEKIEELNPHIIITDIVMPVMDGVQLIEIVHERYPKIKIIVLSSYSNFEYIKNSLKKGAEDYILKPTMSSETLLDAMKKVMVTVDDFGIMSKEKSTPERCVQKLISGFTTEMSDVDLKNIFPYDNFMMVATDIGYVYGSTESLARHNEFLLKAVEGGFNGDYITVQTILEHKIVVLIINTNKSQLINLKERLRELIFKVKNRFGTCFYAVSSPFDSPKDMKNIFRNQILDGLEKRFYLTDATSYFFSEELEVKKPPKFYFSQFLDYLNTRQMNSAFDFVYSFLKDVVEKHSIKESEIKILMHNIVYQIISLFDDLNLGSDELMYFKQDCFMQISKAATAKDLLFQMEIMLADFNEIEKDYHGSQESRTINKILEYISENYTDQLSLKKLSDTFNFNYYYLSSYFSSHCNEGFNEYLNKIRVKKAEELLRTGNMPISEVCGAVGYMDHSYFTKVFKKFTGFTPKQFREKADSVDV